MKSQAGSIHLVSETTIHDTVGGVPVNIVEYESKTITRVVGSTMAVEAGSIRAGLDRHLCPPYD